MPGSLTVEEVFPVTSLPGPILWGTVVGELSRGDQVVLARGSGQAWKGVIAEFDFNRPATARDDQFGLVVRGPIADVVEIGDVIRSVEQ